MSNLTDFFPSGGGGGLTPKFEEFKASGTFTPSQALIDAGGYIEVFLVGSGAGGSGNNNYNSGGEVIQERMYLTSTSASTITIGAGGTGLGTASTANLSSSGGVDLTARGGVRGNAARGLIQWKSPSGSSTGNSSPMSAMRGINGFGMGGSVETNYSGSYIGADNTGQGGGSNQAGGSGYCLIKWYE
jgi:hypothetical protein